MSAGANDRGTCCNSKIEFTKLTGFVGTAANMFTYADGDAGTGSAAAAGAPNVGVACVANT